MRNRMIWVFLLAASLAACGDDGGGADTGTTDSGASDSGTADSATLDSGATDSAVTDSGPMDSSVTDSAVTDTGMADAGMVVGALEQKVLADDPSENNLFGSTVAIDGDTMVVGAQYDGDPQIGAAYVFVRSGTTWSQQAKLTASDGMGQEWFGIAVSISGDTVVIGSVLDEVESGSAYVFVRSGTTWTEQQKLRASDGVTEDWFGESVTIDGDTAIIASTGHNDSAGAAYVFVRSGTTWTQEQKLTASDTAPSDIFGSAVSISGDTALIGARGNDDVFSASGSAYVFVRSGSTWAEQQKITAGDPIRSAQLGWSVSLDGETALVGAPGDMGSAYVFVRAGTTWSQQQKLLASDGAADDEFGTGVSLSGDTALVGSPLDDDGATDTGSAYVFVRAGTTWTEQTKLTDTGLAPGAHFGEGVALDGDTAVAGAWDDFDGGGTVRTGSVYVFRLSSAAP